MRYPPNISNADRAPGAFPAPACKDLRQNAGRAGHFVQFYADDRLLAKNVTCYLSEGLQNGEGGLVIATPAHNDSFIRQLRGTAADPETAVRSGRLLFLDAQETLARFMVCGQPDWDRFETVLSAAVREVAERTGHPHLRAFGEMVGLLWRAGKYSAAVRLEKFWNHLLASHGFNLVCAYPIDIFGAEFQIGGLDAVLCAHTRLLPGARNGDLERAIDRAMDDLLGSKADGLRMLVDRSYRPSWATLPRAEATVLWLRSNLPDRADDILMRARQYYQTSPSASARAA